jgi:PAS domain S-box-containing protein
LAVPPGTEGQFAELVGRRAHAVETLGDDLAIRLPLTLRGLLAARRQARPADSAGRAALIELAHSLGVTLSERVLTRLAVEGIRESLSVDRCGLYVRCPETDELRGTWGTDLEGRTVDRSDVTVPIRPGDPIDRVIRGQATHIHYRAGGPSDAIAWPAEIHAEHEYAGAVMRVGREMVGMITIDQRISGRPITSQQIRDVRLIGELVGMALVNARSYAQATRSTTALRRQIEQMQAVEEALQRSEERLRAVFESASDLIIIKDTELRYVHLNPAAERFVGTKSSELAGRRAEAWTSSRMAEQIEAVQRRVVDTSDPQDTVMPVLDHAGRTAHLHMVCVPLRDADGRLTGLCEIARDITPAIEASRRIEQQHQQQTALFDLFQELTQTLSPTEVVRRAVEGTRRALGFDRASIFLYDAETSTLHGTWGTDRQGRTIDEAALSWEVGPGHPERALIDGDLPYRYLDDAVDPTSTLNADNMAGVRELAAVAIRTGEACQGVMYVDNGISGRHFGPEDLDPLLLFAQLLSLALANARSFADAHTVAQALEQELVERRRAEQAIEAAKRQWERTFDAVPDLVVLVDEAGLIVRANRALLDRAPAKGDELLGRPFEELFPRSTTYRPEFLNAWGLRDADEGTLEVHTGVVEGTFSHTVAPLALEEDGPGGTVHVFHDLTDVMHLQDQLRHIQKMEAVARIAGGVAHDFNNLLTGILGYASLLKLEASEGDSVHTAADVIERAAESGAELSRQLLTFARGGKQRDEVFDVTELVDSAVSLLARTVDRRVSIRADHRLAAAHLRGDPGQIEQIVMNLAINAADAMPEGGEVLISTHRATISTAESIERPGLMAGHWICISVRDTGVGISQEVADRIFEPFFTTKEAGKGTGMGLATVYGVVRSHGGTVDFRSEVGEGTEFTVYLPPATPQEAGDEADSAEGIVRGDSAILVVDDDEGVVAAAAAMLDALGYSVEIARNGREALSIYEDHGHRIDAVLLDIMMPVMDGPECFQEIRRLDPEAKVILSTGYAVEDTVRELMEQGITAFVPKPYSVARLSTVLAEALGHDPTAPASGTQS